MKFSIFDQNLGLTALKKSQYGDNIQILIVYEGLFSTAMIIKSLFPGPFCPKTNKGKIFIFWPKSWVNPFEKSQYGNYVKSIFYSLGGLVL